MKYLLLTTWLGTFFFGMLTMMQSMANAGISRTPKGDRLTQVLGGVTILFTLALIASTIASAAS